MKNIHSKILKRAVALGLAAALLFNPITSSAALLKRGVRNSEVKQVQVALKQLGYFQYPKITGYYGSITVNAVKRFQRAHGISADGIVGNQTKNALIKKTNSAGFKTLSTTSTYDGLLDWYSQVQYIFAKGTSATVTDVDTGKSFQVKRTYGYNHADVEPLTKEDSQIIKNIWNGWGWERRAVIVKVNGKLLAGSMTAMPHAGLDAYAANSIVNNRSDGYGRGSNLDAVKNNGANGVMDIHFLNSRTHSTNVMQSSQQSMVKKAGRYISNLFN